MTATEVNNTVDAHLDDVTIKQLTWKPSVARAVAVAIVRAALMHPNSLYPDEVEYSALCLCNSDANCIGTAWRRLQNAGIIRHGTAFRRSTIKQSRGRTIFSYDLTSVKRAKTFLERNGEGINGIEQQQEML